MEVGEAWLRRSGLAEGADLAWHGCRRGGHPWPDKRRLLTQSGCLRPGYKALQRVITPISKALGGRADGRGPTHLGLLVLRLLLVPAAAVAAAAEPRGTAAGPQALGG